MHFFLYKERNCPFSLGDIEKITGIRYVVETLFIILDRYMKLYIFDPVKIVHVRAMVI